MKNNVTTEHTNSNPIINNYLIKEMIDRQAKQNNVLLCNLIEAAPGSDSHVSDMSVVLEIYTFLQLDIQITHIYRLGNTSSPCTRPRPQKIIIQNQKDAFKIFSTLNNLKSSQNWKDLRLLLIKLKYIVISCSSYMMNFSIGDQTVNQT